MKEHTTFFSDGDGQVYEAEINTNLNETSFNDNHSRGSKVEVEIDPFAGLPNARDAKTIPESLSAAFNKILEVKIDEITYRYRELSFIEQLSLGTNPFLTEALKIYNPGDDKLDEDEFVQNLLENKNEEELDKLTYQANLHRDKVLLESLVEMKSGNDIIAINAEVVAALKVELKDDLYSVILKEGTVEENTVRQFPNNTEE